MKIVFNMLLTAATLLALTACHDEPPKPWIPVLEQVDFVGLHDAVAEVQRHVDQATAQLQSNGSGAAVKDLEMARQSLFKIERYFLPLTEVRQLVYDADRVYFLGRTEAAQGKLRGATALLNKVGAAGGKSLDQAATEVVVKIEVLEHSIASNSPQVAKEMRALGEKVNLMILKGDLVLAGVTFPPEE